MRTFDHRSENISRLHSIALNFLLMVINDITYSRINAILRAASFIMKTSFPEITAKNVNKQSAP